MTLMDVAVPPAPEPAQSAASPYALCMCCHFRRAKRLSRTRPCCWAATRTLWQGPGTPGQIASKLSPTWTRCDLRAFEVTGEEQGFIPMTTRHFPLRTGKHTFAISLAGSAARPSSGYAFLRIQRQCRQLAALGAHGSPRPPQTPAPIPTALLDSIFLRVIRQDPDAVPGYFERRFARVAPDARVRFLSGTASLLGCLTLARALPLGSFRRAAASGVPRFSGGQTAPSRINRQDEGEANTTAPRHGAGGRLSDAIGDERRHATREAEPCQSRE